MNERRAAPRYELELVVRVGSVSARTRNVSLDGLLFVSPQQFVEGDSVPVLVSIPLEAAGNAIVIDAAGRVLRCNREGEQFVTAVHFDTVQFRVDPPGLADSPAPSRDAELPRRSV